MDIIKKLFITSFALLLVTFGSNNMAYATELANPGILEDTYLSEEMVISDTEETDKANTDEAVTNDTETVGAVENTENIFDPEYYEVFVDEQGQVFYIEREPVEIDIQDSDEVVQDEELVEESEKIEKKEKKASYSEKDLRLLSSLIYSEAGNQSYKGMLAVANVVLNRVKSNAYSHVDTIEEVVYDKQWAVQFSVTIKSKKTGKSVLDKALEAYDTGNFPGKNPEAEKKAMNKAIKAAKAALNGENNIGDYLCFRMNNKGASSIKKKYGDYMILGNHIFYRTK